MSKADKMFEDLGYKIIPVQGGLSYYLELYDVTIYFLDGTRTIYYDNDTSLMSIEIHLAIHEKLKELGWIE